MLSLPCYLMSLSCREAILTCCGVGPSTHHGRREEGEGTITMMMGSLLDDSSCTVLKQQGALLLRMYGSCSAVAWWWQVNDQPKNFREAAQRRLMRDVIEAAAGAYTTTALPLSRVNRFNSFDRRLHAAGGGVCQS